MKNRIGLILASLALLPAVAGAQAPFAAGDRVRIYQIDGRVTTGTLSEAGPQEVRLATLPSDPPFVFQLSEVDRMERSLGRQPRFFRNFFLGVGITAVGGGLVSAVTWDPCTETGWFACFMEPNSRSDAFVWGFLAGGIVGIPVGFLAGAFVRSERWEDLPIPGRAPGIAVRPILGDRVGFSVSIPMGGGAAR